jgi:hypothetical protein
MYELWRAVVFFGWKREINCTSSYRQLRDVDMSCTCGYPIPVRCPTGMNFYPRVWSWAGMSCTHGYCRGWAFALPTPYPTCCHPYSRTACVTCRWVSCGGGGAQEEAKVMLQNRSLSIFKWLAKWFCKNKYDYFLRKLFSNRLYIHLPLFFRSLFYISVYLNLATRGVSHLHVYSLWHAVQQWCDIFRYRVRICFREVVRFHHVFFLDVFYFWD